MKGQISRGVAVCLFYRIRRIRDKVIFTENGIYCIIITASVTT